MFMPWRDEFSVGIAVIDKQHYWLVDATNRLYEEMNKPECDRVVLAEILEGLMDYTVNHFILEEEYFERYAYPGALAHKALHDKFTKAIMAVLTNFENGSDVRQETLELLKHWLSEHILRADKEYVLFFQEIGVTVI